MKGIFIKNRFFIILNIFGIISGIILAAMLPFFIIVDSEITTDDILGFSFFALFGMLVAAFSIASLLFNKGASLTLDDKGVSARYSWKGNFECSYTDIAFCEYGINTLNIRLNNDKYYIISGLLNAAEICAEIRKKITKREEKEFDILYDKIQELKKQRKKWLIWTIVFGTFMFINIGLAVFLTGGKELSEFASNDWTAFICLGILEILVVTMTFFFAGKCGKLNRILSEKAASLKKLILQTAPLPSGNLIKTFIDTDYTARAIVFGYPNQNDVYFVVQVVDKSFNIITTHTSEVFSSIDELKPLLGELIEI